MGVVAGAGTETGSESTNPLINSRMVPYLFLALQADRISLAPLRIRLEGLAEVLIGRDGRRQVDLVTESTGDMRMTLLLADSKISTRHARLSRAADGWRLEDLGSRNGTFVNGAAVEVVTLHT